MTPKWHSYHFHLLGREYMMSKGCAGKQRTALLVPKLISTLSDHWCYRLPNQEWMAHPTVTLVIRRGMKNFFPKQERYNLVTFVMCLLWAASSPILPLLFVYVLSNRTIFLNYPDRSNMSFFVVIRVVEGRGDSRLCGSFAVRNEKINLYEKKTDYVGSIGSHLANEARSMVDRQNPHAFIFNL